MKIHFRFRTIIYIITALLILSVLTTIGYFCNFDNILKDYSDIGYFELLLGQIANTLIVLSLTSVLSSNFGHAYWVDIKDSKLIEPFWTCFVGITVYLLTGLVYSIAAYILHLPLGVIISYLLSTALLILLTFKMISIYFGKEELKKRLFSEYRQLLMLNNNSYVDDYLRHLEKYLADAEQQNFPGKKHLLRNIRSEIKELKSKLDSKDETLIDKAHTTHIDNFIKGQQTLQEIDLKIQQYTKDAIANNETEIVHENIELLIECESYHTFFHLLEELFEWDEKYTCYCLKQISQKNRIWVIKDNLNFFKQYALQKLMSESGKLDAIQDLLFIYDGENLGMKQLAPALASITDQCSQLNDLRASLEKEMQNAEDPIACHQRQKKQRLEIEKEEELIREELVSILKNASAKDLRSFYVPIKEAMLAHDEGHYEIVNKYLTVILKNYRLEIESIKYSCNITDIDSPLSLELPYLTEEETTTLYRLLEKDRLINAIPETVKSQLLDIKTIRIDNHPMSGITKETLDIYNSTIH